MRLSSALVRSASLAVVTAALSALLTLLLGSVAFFLRVRMGRADALAGFEPNLFMRSVGLPLAVLVFVGTFAVSVWRLRTDTDR